MVTTSKSLRRGCTFALAALALASAAAPQAKAAFIYFDPATPIAIPPTPTSGYYLDLTTGNFGPVGTVANPDIGWYSTTTGPNYVLHFGIPTGTTGGFEGAALNSPLNLAPGTYIGPGSSFYNGTGLGAAFHQNGTEIAGYEFTDPNTGNLDYGWIEVATTSGFGYPAEILNWGYDNTGAPAFAGLPEPTSLGAIGAVAMLSTRRRRRI